MFIINEDETERTPYGSEVIAKIDNVCAVSEVIAAVTELNAMADNKAVVSVLANGRPTGAFVSAVLSQNCLVLDVISSGEMQYARPPIKAGEFVQGLRAEAKGTVSVPVVIKTQDGETRKIKAARLEKYTDDNSKKSIYFIMFFLGESFKARLVNNTSVNAPRNSDDVKPCLQQLARASNRPNLPDEILLCNIPSVPNKYVGDEDIASQVGTTCVIDTVFKKGQHLELNLMSVTLDEIMNMQLNPDDQQANKIANKCKMFGDGLALFFMYNGVPYAASEFKVESGTPPTLILEPWSEVDEDISEIGFIAAQYMKNGII